MPGLQDIPPETQPLERPRHERLQHDVEARQQLAQELAPLRRVQIQRHQTFVAGVDLPPEWLSVRGPLSKGVAGPRLLDLDDIGAKVRQQHAGEAAGDHSGDVENPNPRERLWASGSQGIHRYRRAAHSRQIKSSRSYTISGGR